MPAMPLIITVVWPLLADVNWLGRLSKTGRSAILWVLDWLLLAKGSVISSVANHPATLFSRSLIFCSMLRLGGLA